MNINHKHILQRPLTCVKVMILSIIKNPLKTVIAITIIAAISIFLVCANWNWVSSTIFPNTILGVYRKEFWENVLVEMHGMILDLVVVGILIFWLDSRRAIKSEIHRQLEDLVDYASLDSPEVNLKKIGHIKRLNSVGVKCFNVQNLTLSEVALSGVSVENSKMIGLKISGGKVSSSEFINVQMRSSDFENCTIRNAKFEASNLLKSKFKGAVCKGVSFRGACLERVDFTDCDLQSAILREADLRGAIFKGANLKQCSLMDAKNIDLGELSKASCLDHIAMSEENIMQLVSLRSDMKYQIKNSRA
jgi:uncharacterized protein YjbI with pentapeptide repeats